MLHNTRLQGDEEGTPEADPEPGGQVQGRGTAVHQQDPAGVRERTSQSHQGRGQGQTGRPGQTITEGYYY